MVDIATLKPGMDVTVQVGTRPEDLASAAIIRILPGRKRADIVYYDHAPDPYDREGPWIGYGIPLERVVEVQANEYGELLDADANDASITDAVSLDSDSDST